MVPVVLPLTRSRVYRTSSALGFSLTFFSLIACGAPRHPPEHVLSTNCGAITALMFSPNGGTLACASQSEIQLWDAAGRTLLRVIWRGDHTLRALSFGPDGHELLAGHSDGRIDRWNLRSAALTGSLRDTAPVESLVVAATGPLMVTAGGRGARARIWDLSSARIVRTLPAEGAGRVGLDDAGRILVVAISKLRLQVLDVSTGNLLATLAPQGDWWEHTEALTVSRNGRWAASGTNAGGLELWDLGARRSLRTLRGHVSSFQETEGVLSVAFSHAGNLLASSGLDGTVRVWDVQRGRLLNVLSELSQLALDWDPNRKTPAAALAFSPAGDLLGSGHNDGKVRLWRLRPRSGS